MKKTIFILFIAIVLFAVGYYFWTTHDEQQPKYLTEEVIRADVEKNVIASGTIESINEVDVGAQVSGKITKLYVTLGQDIKKGDLIAEIDSTTQNNELDTKKAQLNSFKAQLKAKQTGYNIALSSYHRLNKLYAQKATSLDALDTAKNALESATAEVNALKESIKQAEIEVNTAETKVGYTKITSPIDGTVISTPISEGQTVNANQTTPTIVKVADLTRMRIKPEVSEGDITKVKAGQDVTFTILSDSSTIYHAVIDSVDPATTGVSNNNVSSGTTGTSSSSSVTAVYYYANMIVDNPERILRIGMTTENKIKIAHVRHVLVISNMALQQNNGKYFVSVLENGQAQRREVEIGVRNDFQTEIKAGLSEGEKVILSQVNAGEQVGTMTRGPRVL